MPERVRFTIQSPGIAVALALSLLVAISEFLIWQQYVKTSDRARQTTGLLMEVKDLMTDVLDAESSARGVLSSNDRKTLEHFASASAAAQSKCTELSSVKGDFKDPGELLVKLSGFASQRIRLLRNAVERPGDNSVARQASIASVQLDEPLMEEIRELQARVQSNLRESLRIRRDQSRSLARISEWVSTIGCAGIFAIVLLSQMRIRRLGTSRMRLNEELALANEDLRQFVYSASHDLQEPLRVLMLYSDLVEKNVVTQRPVTKEIAHLRGAAVQMSALVSDLLSYSQLVSGLKKSNAQSDLRVEAERALETLQAFVQETGAELSIGALPTVQMESSHALLLFQNLIGNSLKYRTPDTVPNIRILAEQAPGKWIVSVADNGIGIAPAYHGQIFGIFKRLHTRTAYPGTGLGLAICRRIVERYGGAIWVESELGKGSNFRFSLPDASPR